MESDVWGVQAWASHLTPLSLSFLICQIRHFYPLHGALHTSARGRVEYWHTGSAFPCSCAPFSLQCPSGWDEGRNSGLAYCCSAGHLSRPPSGLCSCSLCFSPLSRISFLLQSRAFTFFRISQRRSLCLLPIAAITNHTNFVA